ncbi:MAG: DUF1501 domain-containing protein [Phycisphaeraceae bacterium]|nr:DUF1501 domain-containing protein [Phycisphaeraceae bacterium]
MNVTRRFFLQSTGALALYLGVSPLTLLGANGLPLGTRTVKKGKTLVVIFLRGGADGLNLVVPHADAAYAKMRPSIAVPGPAAKAEGRAIDLDGFFGLHPRLAPLVPLFESGMAVAAHAVGYDKNTRSHFEEQDTWETGMTGNTIHSDGWLNRHLATSQGHGQIRAVSIGDALPRILHGKAPAFAIRGLDDLTVPTGKAPTESIAAALEHAYCCGAPSQRAGVQADATDLLSQSAGTTLDGMEQLRELAKAKYEPAAPYPRSGLAGRLMQVARLIKADVGLEVAELDLGGWDTHNNQGNGQFGPLANLAGELAEAVAAFTADMGDRMEDVLLVTISDFGRTAHENGTNGTDHGWANCLFAVGGAVQRAGKANPARGRVVGQWPGLAPDQLHQKRDLLHTTDFRDVLGELVKVHLGNDNIQTVLPQHQFKPVGLVA